MIFFNNKQCKAFMNNKEVFADIGKGTGTEIIEPEPPKEEEVKPPEPPPETNVPEIDIDFYHNSYRKTRSTTNSLVTYNSNMEGVCCYEDIQYASKLESNKPKGECVVAFIISISWSEAYVALVNKKCTINNKENEIRWTPYLKPDGTTGIHFRYNGYYEEIKEWRQFRRKNNDGFWSDNDVNWGVDEDKCIHCFALTVLYDSLYAFKINKPINYEILKDLGIVLEYTGKTVSGVKERSSLV